MIQIIDDLLTLIPTSQHNPNSTREITFVHTVSSNGIPSNDLSRQTTVKRNNRFAKRPMIHQDISILFTGYEISFWSNRVSLDMARAYEMESWHQAGHITSSIMYN